LKDAFMASGFDPDAVDNTTFVICGDVHEPEYSENLPAQIVEWNAMQPAPRFISLLGDNICSASRSFGSMPKDFERAHTEMRGLREKLNQLNPQIPLKLVIGNHDSYPGEVDAGLFRSEFPEVKPYETFDESGIRFMIWNGGHDGGIDPKQREWIAEQCQKTPKDQSVVILVHQPALGQTVRERGIPLAVWKNFAEAERPVWLLAGHAHCNALRVFSLPKTTIAQAVHVKSVDGYWVYGMCDGKIAARVYRSMKDGFSVQPMPSEATSVHRLPLPFEGREDLLWTLLIGDDQKQTEAAFVSGTGGNCGTWWFYVKELVFRLPLQEKARGAKHFAVLAAMSKNRKTGELPHIFVSGDGTTWQETALLDVVDSVNRYAIPESLQASRELFVKVESFGYGADTCVGGFALCK
jgi:calcineurin-like phosphoesterase family protein